MALRNALLALGAALVLGLGIYLFHEVRASPADAEPRGTDHPRPTSARREPEPRQSGDEPPEAAKESGVQPRHHTPDTRPGPPVVEVHPPGPGSDDDSGIDPTKPNPKLDALMVEANRAYDHGEFDDAKAIAQRVLAKVPTNVRMLRILVSSACIDGDAAEAQKQYSLLPPGDRDQMKTRCSRYGITFTDPPPPPK